MFDVKKTVAAVIALGSSVAFAGTMGPVCAPGNVSVPCDSLAYDIGFQALYLKPSYSGPLRVIGAHGSGERIDLDLDAGWGFRLEGSYHFNTGNDININSTTFSKSNRYETIIDLEPITGEDISVDASLDWKPSFNAVNFELGQHVDFGEMKNIRFHAGAQYASIKSKLSVTDRVTQERGNFDIKFDGFGPRAGMDMSYDFGNGFEVYGNTAGALLVGSSKLANIVKSTIIVPELEAKLGAKYNYAMAQGDLIVDAGWMVTNYFNAQNVVIADSDFGFQGPFIGVKYIGNA